MSKGIAVIPLAKFTSEADHKLVADLATSVERTAVVRWLRAMAENQTFAQRAQSALRIAAEDIEKAYHV